MSSWLVAFLSVVMLQVVSPQLPQICQNPKQNYAFATVENVIHLGDGNGVLAFNPSLACFDHIDPVTLMPHLLEPKSKTQEVCNEVCNQLAKKKIDPDSKYFLHIGSKMYYVNNQTGAVDRFYLEASQTDNLFKMKNIDSWINDKLKGSMVLVQTNPNIPSYPSFLLAEGSKIYFHLSDAITGSGQLQQVGTSKYDIKAMHLQNRVVSSQTELLVLFGSYFGRVKFDLKKFVDDKAVEDKGQLTVFPILPSQSLLLCPIHFCWWPQVVDIVYNAATSTYYIFQNKWVFFVKEGVTGHNQLDVEHAVNIENCGIKSQVQAAFWEVTRDRLGVLVKSDEVDGRMKLNVLVRKLVENTEKPGFAEDAESASKIDLIIGLKDEVLCAEFMKVNSGQSKDVIANAIENYMLWVAVYENTKEKVVFIGFDASLETKIHTIIYKRSQTIETVGHSTISAMFYHPKYDHLFMLSGFFLYVYQKGSILEANTSYCSVTYVNRWFNCTDDYYNPKEMNLDGHPPVIESKAGYFKAAEVNHYGKFLPDQCNFEPNNPLVFYSKRRGFLSFFSNPLLVIASIGSVLLIFLSLAAFRRMKTRKRSKTESLLPWFLVEKNTNSINGKTNSSSKTASLKNRTAKGTLLKVASVLKPTIVADTINTNSINCTPTTSAFQTTSITKTKRQRLILSGKSFNKYGPKMKKTSLKKSKNLAKTLKPVTFKAKKRKQSKLKSLKTDESRSSSSGKKTRISKSRPQSAKRVVSTVKAVKASFDKSVKPLKKAVCSCK